MTSEINKTPAPGWIGGFEESNRLFAYPDPNLNSLPSCDNMMNLDKLQRQHKVYWPEFSWETELGKPGSRCFQRFSHNISRLGYTDEGRIFSIICPQQGFYSSLFGVLNVEVTVTGNRGWVNETTKEMAADMSVVGKIWYSPSPTEHGLVKKLYEAFKDSRLPFPVSKANAIRVNTFNPAAPKEILFPLRSGQSTGFPIPEFAQHTDEAWDVAHLGVKIGNIDTYGEPIVDEFNHAFMHLFNLASGNMLAPDNVLFWNVWFTAPEIVDQEEWASHAKKWRDSIDTGCGSPGGPSSTPRFFDGTEFKPLESIKAREEALLISFVEKHFKHLL